MLTRRLVLIAVAICTGLPALSQNLAVDNFRNITDSGLLLYNYDMACWIASDSLMAIHPDESRMGMYLAHQSGPNWVVTFGQLTRDVFLSAYEVTIDHRTNSCQISEFAPAKRGSEKLFKASRALITAGDKFGPHKISYNSMVLPESDSSWSVYFVPALTSYDTLTVGADIKYTVSFNGTTILKETPFHKTLLLMPRPPEGVVGAMHSHVLIDGPVETDVFYVLRQKPRVNHIIAANDKIFQIDTSGTIRVIPKDLLFK